MVRPNIRKLRYLIALIITVIVFLIGIFIGYTLTNSRIKFSENISNEQRLEFDSLQLQYLYMTEFLEEENCPAALKTLDENLKNLELARERLEKFLESDDEEELKRVKRDYILAEIRYWLLSKRSKEICPEDDTVLILYFYSSRDCDDCEIQGAILSSLKDELKEKLLIFSIDSTFTEEPMVNILLEFYNFNSTPVMVVNSLPIKEFIKKVELKEIICSQFKQKIDSC